MVEKILRFLEDKSLDPDEINGYLGKAGTSEIRQKVKAINIAARPQIELKDYLRKIEFPDEEIMKSERFDEVAESAEIKIKYEGYIERERNIADKIKRLDGVRIPEDLDYSELMSISTEGRQKLSKIRPANIGQAGRIIGVSPSDISILLMYLGR